jgi:hypothetical protein
MAPLMVALAVMFVERPGAKWVALVGLFGCCFSSPSISMRLVCSRKF